VDDSYQTWPDGSVVRAVSPHAQRRLWNAPV